MGGDHLAKWVDREMRHRWEQSSEDDQERREKDPRQESKDR